MKNAIRSILLLLACCVPGLVSAQSYQDELNKVNTYLKTFDNGYYGYLEVKDGYLYDRFKSGEHSKADISKLGKAKETETSRKVQLYCKSDQECVFSTYTDSYHSSMSFSQSSNFNTSVLINLLDDLVAALQGNTFNQNYQAELSKVNTFLKTFDNGYYGYLEVKDGYLYDRFKSGDHTKTPISDLGEAKTVETNRKVQLFCKGEKNCVFSTYTNSNHSTMSFSQSSDFNTATLVNLLNNLVASLQGNSTVTTSSTNNSSSSSANTARVEREKQTTQHMNQPSTTTTTPTTKPTTTTSSTTTAPVSSSYSTQLSALNAYLKIFNPETYGEVSVKESKVFFEFKVYTQRYYSSIPISALTQETIVTKGSLLGEEEIKIQCKGETDCFYSSYSSDYTDHFRFFSHTVDDLSKMQRLVQDFVDALK